jgi:hypothetical protein
MKYIVYAVTLSFLVACGNQDHQSTKGVHLLNNEISKAKSEVVNIEENKTEPIVSTEIKIDSTTTPTSIASDLNLTKTNTPPQLAVVEESSSLRSLLPIEINMTTSVDSKIEENSTLNMTHLVTDQESRVSMPIDRVKLAEIEAKMREELLSLKIQHEQSLKEMELAIKKNQALQIKEIEMTKLAQEQEIQKQKASDEKELSTIKLSNQQKIEMAKIASQKELEAKQKAIEEARVIYEKEVALAKLKTQRELAQRQERVKLAEAKREKEVALATLKSEKINSDKRLEFYKMIAIIITGLIVFGLLILYFIVQRKRKNEIKLQENELRHKEYLEASKQHNEHVKRMLEIITDEGMDKGIKKEMMRLLKDQSSQANLIEHKG